VSALRAAAVAALVAAGCRSAAAPEAAPQAAPLAETPVSPDGSSAALGADARWRACVASTESAAQSVWPSAAAAIGFAFDAGREPMLAYDPAAPAEGDVVLRFVNGVRRPVARLQPQALLRGEFVVPDDLAPLMTSAALLSAAREHALPAWVVAGGGVAAGGAFDRRVHACALGGPEVRSREADIFGAAPEDPLAAAARVKALLRISRGERALARFVTALSDGRDEDTALALVGVSDRAFLDAAAGTERAHAASAIADDPALPMLVAARAALARGDVDAAADALAPLASSPVAADPWLAADLRLCQALVAAARGDAAGAKAAIDAAPPSRIVRIRERRIVETCIVPASQRGAAVRSVLTDWPDLATAHPGDLAMLLGIPPSVRAAQPATVADVVSPEPERRRAAAAALKESRAASVAPALRLLARDGDASVRAAALAGLAAVAGGAAADDLETATHDPDGGVRRAALALLAESDRARAAKRAAELTGDDDPAVRALAAELARTK
jgi:HEAT repeat protein